MLLVYLYAAVACICYAYIFLKLAETSKKKTTFHNFPYVGGTKFFQNLKIG